MAPGDRAWAGTETATTDWELSSLEYDAVCTWLGIGEMPYPVGIPRHGKTMAVRERLLAEARESLSADGLFRSGEVSAKVANVLRVVTNAGSRVDLFGFDGGPIRAVATRLGHDSVLVADDGERILLRSVADVTAPVALLGLVPGTGAAPHQGVRVPLAALSALAAQQQANESGEPFGGASWEGDFVALTRQGVAPADARLLLKFAKGRIRGGQLGVHTTRRGDDRPHRDDVTLSFYDNPFGRYLVVNDGSWVSVTPADNFRIARRVEESLHADDPPGRDDSPAGPVGDIPSPIW